MHEKAEFQELHAAYRRAWRQYATEVDLWHSLEAAGVAAQAAVEAMRHAEAAYRDSRNCLVDYMISNRLSGSRTFRAGAETFKVAVASVVAERGPSVPTA